MTTELKPIAKVKVGIWLNRVKMRKVIDKLSLYYGFILSGIGAINLINGNYYQGTFEIIMSAPLWLIQWSKIKFDKMGIREEIGNDKN